jgi:hypothetical protein
VASLPTQRPALNANKPEWVGWAVKNGMSPDDAEALTKTDLIAPEALDQQLAIIRSATSARMTRIFSFVPSSARGL